jgi:protein-L-isoaspartate(D-aspartate) O-methyltransferase
MIIEDTFLHQGQRKKLVETLVEKGIKNEDVLAVIGKIPRHVYFDKVFHTKFAYEDVAFPIGAGQTISQPYTVAFQSDLLNISKGHKVLEIGTGSGYQTAVLCELGAKVYTIERQRELFVKTKRLLHDMNYRTNAFFGDGFIGKEAFAPYDSIIITCGAPHIPEELVKQLKIGGRLVIPIGEGDKQIMTLIVKTAENTIVKTEFGEFSFVPMLMNKQY